MTKLFALIVGNPGWVLGILAALVLAGGLQELRIAWAKSDAAEAREGKAQAETALANLQTQLANARADAEQQARELERKHQATVAELTARAQQRFENAINAKDQTIADLRAGTLRLRHHWAGCETGRLSEAVATAAGPDDAAQRRAEDSGALVRIGAECDAVQRGFIEYIGSLGVMQD